jgi:sodium transport system permease protein
MNLAWVVCRKELLDNARDRRTLFSTLLFGPLFAPLLFSVIINMAVSRNLASLEESLDVPILGLQQADNLGRFLRARGIAPSENHGLATLEDAAAAVRVGEHDLVIALDDEFAEEFHAGDLARVTLIYDQSNSRANSRVQRARRALAAYSEQLGALRLLARGIHPSILRPMAVDEYDVSTPAGRSTLLLGMLTYFLLLAMLMGGFYLAIDTTAGERERKSLEPLLATPISRRSLLLGKMAATSCYMLLSLLLTLCAFTIALGFLPLDELGMSSNFGARAALAAFVVLAPVAPFGAALMTLVASFTRSYKEAQTYLGLVILLPTLPLVFASVLNVTPSLRLMWVPSLSQHLLVTNLIRQEPVALGMLAVSALSTIGLAAVLAAIAIRLYKREALLG